MSSAMSLIRVRERMAEICRIMTTQPLSPEQNQGYMDELEHLEDIVKTNEPTPIPTP